MSTTNLAETGLAHPQQRSEPVPRAFWATLGVAVLAVFVISLPNLADPMIRFDDYPAYFSDPSGFWAKTLHEGRWINYLWHLREVVTPAWLNFAVYQLLWAGFAAAAATCAMRSGGALFFAVALALMILVSPSAMLISLWFNTLIPGLALVTLYAVLAVLLSPQATRALLPLFVILTFMAYTTYPLLVLAIAVLSTPKRSLLDLVALLGLFSLSFLAAVLTVYALNWQVHGIFGVPLADWRDAAPASDLTGYIGNLPKLSESVWSLLDKMSFGFFPAAVFHLGLLAGGLAVLARRAPLEALYLAAGLVTGLALVSVQVLKLGAIVPPRAFIFAWVFYAVIAVRAAQELSDSTPLGGRLARNAVLLVVMSYLLQVFLQYTTYRPWQNDTRALASLATNEGGQIFFGGSPTELRSAQEAGIQDVLGFVFRIEQMTGQKVVLCDTAPGSCDARREGLASPVLGVSTILQDTGLVLVFPEKE